MNIWLVHVYSMVKGGGKKDELINQQVWGKKMNLLTSRSVMKRIPSMNYI